MTNIEKIELINTLHSKVTDWYADGECCNYVLVPADDESKDVLLKLGLSEEYIEANEEDGVFDLTSIGFKFAKWWESENGFSDKIIRD